MQFLYLLLYASIRSNIILILEYFAVKKLFLDFFFSNMQRQLQATLIYVPQIRIRTPSQTRIMFRDSTTPPLHHSKNTMQQFSIPSTKRSKPSPKQTGTRLP
ncbi:hypothetical protein TNIN_331981 [Trichonephila inaurata madagascariensis]|uniref:Uncharacterized protein n=1 Tax=Trichonephila inaurata madagascariensis TaxID=2747483 RepID=A0A8X6X5X4_9ARAC|nr:hypothetical protein TNIN_331981 [Trichonephila inaurata madagascariensis]